jgi:hypothetical protein
MPEATHEMIVYHPDRLHERIADGGADKLKSTPAQVGAHGV